MDFLITLLKVMQQARQDCLKPLLCFQNFLIFSKVSILSTLENFLNWVMLTVDQTGCNTSCISKICEIN